MTCPRLDHWGMSVDTEEQLDDYLERAKQFQKEDPRVDIIDKHVDATGPLALTSFYVAYLLPMMVEVQHWNWKGTSRACGARSLIPPRARVSGGALTPRSSHRRRTARDPRSRIARPTRVPRPRTQRRTR